jgi:3-isopropylmalate dehydrogenase
MMLRFSLGNAAAAGRIERAVQSVLESGHRTRDMGGTVGTRAMGDVVVAAL